MMNDEPEMTNDEPDGMLAYALAMENPDRDDPNWPLPSFDAQDWGAAFVKIAADLGHPGIDEAWMIGWFANALMRGFDEHARRAALAAHQTTTDGAKALDLPESLLGHWDTADGRDMAARYANLDRPARHMGSDMALANAAFMELHEPLGGAVKERIRWLSVQLALARQALAAYRAAQDQAPDGYVLALLDRITPDVIDQGAQRLASFEDNSVWPDSWGKLDVLQMRIQAERVIRSAIVALSTLTPPAAQQPNGDTKR